MDRITLAHGNGGQLTQELVEDIIYQYCANDILLKQDDAAYLSEVRGELVTSTDSFVVDPIFFPGGDIGKLAVCGTINDLAMNGAKPLYLTLGLILEEGLKVSSLKQIIKSVASTAKEAEVKIVAGDTKVVPRGKGGKIYINTTGIGVLGPEVKLKNSEPKLGDKIIVSGTLGEHGATILASREDFDLDHQLNSDCALLSNLVQKVLKVSSKVKLLRDPTRGGIATTLNEIADYYQLGISLVEAKLPILTRVHNLANILGIDPLYFASEGRFIAIVDQEEAEQVIEKLHQDKLGQKAVIIGEVINRDTGVYLQTKFGGTRILRSLDQQLLPRIC